MTSNTPTTTNPLSNNLKYPITTLFGLSPPTPLSLTLPYICHIDNAIIKRVILECGVDLMVRNCYDAERQRLQVASKQGDDSDSNTKEEPHKQQQNPSTTNNQLAISQELHSELLQQLNQIHEQLVDIYATSSKSSSAKKHPIETAIPPSSQQIIYSIYQLYKHAIYLRLPAQIFQRDLCLLMEESFPHKQRRQLKLQKDKYEKEVFRVARLLSSYYKKKRDHFMQSLKQVARKTHDSLVDFRWRLDVTISNSMTNKVFTPLIWMQVKLDNGREECFEVSLDKFHQLRLEVAEVLQQMNEIQSHPMMNIEEK